MQEIKCPNCGEVFQVDETGYNQIVRQIRDKEFDREIKQREKELDEKKKKELELIRLQEKKTFDEGIASKDTEILKINQLVAELQAKLDASETAKNLAVSEALEKKNQELSKEAIEHSKSLSKKEADISDRDKTILELQAKLDASKSDMQLAVAKAVKAKEADISDRDKTIIELRAKLDASKSDTQLAVAKAVEVKNEELSKKASEIANLKGELKSKETENRLNEKSLKEQYEEKLKLKDEQIEYYKDFKARQSTKMIGESLEQHCLTQFNSIRMTAFPNAYFEKDNDARFGSKGDFIYRECGEDGTEFISIMFEMKNEADTTATKHKNEDFLRNWTKTVSKKAVNMPYSFPCSR